MTEEIRYKILKKASLALESAKSELDSKHLEFAVN